MDAKQQMAITPAHDQELNLATATSRHVKKWKNKPMTWSAFLQKLQTPVVTPESLEEFLKLSKAKQDDIKDVGGYVGGFLKEGRRKANYVQSRSILTLDVDFATPTLIDDIKLLFDNEMAIYSTHKHKTDKPRLRLIIPLKRPVTPDEYQPVARKVAELFGMDLFDDTTYQPERLMYWPSHSSNGDYVFEYLPGDWLDPDEVLAQYDNWRDSTFWPESSRQREIHVSDAKKQGDPLTKKGVIGAFNRTYDIRSAIEKFLPDIYTPTDHEDRFTYAAGSTEGGLVLYDDKFAYSHHGTDPVGDTLNNAFDLVRKQLFGDQDDDAKEDTPVTRLPSYKAMREFVLGDDDAKRTLASEQISDASSDFADPVSDEDDTWLTALELNDRGEIESSARNLELIMHHDENLKDKFYTDSFANRLTIKGKVPWQHEGDEPYWKDSDDAGLRIYLERTYKIVNRGKIEDAFIQEAERNAVHPVREYLNGLTWDGQPRVETLLVDYLGAADTPYTRLVTRKFLAAAIARIMCPGVKFDYMIVTSGPQGIGKTLLPQRLAGAWFSNSLESVQGKDAYESLQGAWIMEMGEMNATKKADIEATKHFISKTEDIFRVAYGRHKSYFPRQCVFWGTSNDSEFLRDRTGNRRFWPVDVGLYNSKKKIWTDLTKAERDQIWAEAKTIYEKGENLYLNAEEERLAVDQQKMHTEVSALEGMIQEFVETPITEDWYSRSAEQRRQYIQEANDDEIAELGNVRRDKVAVIEVWNELLKGDPRNLVPVKAAEIRNILTNMDGWQKYQKSKGQSRFGTDYGRQVTYIRSDLAELPDTRR